MLPSLHCRLPAQASIPKQYLELQGQPIATYSLRTFVAMPTIREVVVVCEPEWRCVSECGSVGHAAGVAGVAGGARMRVCHELRELLAMVAV